MKEEREGEGREKKKKKKEKKNRSVETKEGNDVICGERGGRGKERGWGRSDPGGGGGVEVSKVSE